MFDRAKFRISENTIRRTANSLSPELTDEWDDFAKEEQIAIFHAHDKYFRGMSLEDFEECLQEEMMDIYHAVGKKNYAKIVSWIDMQFAFYKKLGE